MENEISKDEYGREGAARIYWQFICDNYQKKQLLVIGGITDGFEKYFKKDFIELPKETQDKIIEYLFATDNKEIK